MAALFVMFSVSVYAQCTDTNSEDLGIEAPFQTDSVPSVTTCTTAAGCGATTTSLNPTIIAAPSLSSLQPGCLQGPFAFTGFTILWENFFEGFEEISYYNKIAFGGTTNDRVFATGRFIDPDSGEGKALMAAFDKSTGTLLWNYFIPDERDSEGMAVFWDPVTSLVAFGIRNTPLGDPTILFYVFDETGLLQPCRGQISDAGFSYEVFETVLQGTSLFIVGTRSADPIVHKVDLSSCTDIATALTGTAGGKFKDIVFDAAGNVVVAGEMSISGTGKAILGRYSDTVLAELAFDGYNIGSSGNFFDEVTVDPTTDMAYVAGSLASDATVCAEIGTWTGDCRTYAPGSGGEFFSITHGSDIFVGGTVFNPDGAISDNTAAMLRINPATGAVVWKKENYGNPDAIVAVGTKQIFSTAASDNSVIGIGGQGSGRGGLEWTGDIRDKNTGALINVHKMGENTVDNQAFGLNVVRDTSLSDTFYAVGMGSPAAVAYSLAAEPTPTPTPAPVPEFSSITLLFAALVAIAGVLLLRRKN